MGGAHSIGLRPGRPEGEGRVPAADGGDREARPPSAPGHRCDGSPGGRHPGGAGGLRGSVSGVLLRTDLRGPPPAGLHNHSTGTPHRAARGDLWRDRPQRVREDPHRQRPRRQHPLAQLLLPGTARPAEGVCSLHRPARVGGEHRKGDRSPARDAVRRARRRIGDELDDGDPGGLGPARPRRQ